MDEIDLINIYAHGLEGVEAAIDHELGRITALEAEVERLRGALKSARDWMIQVDQDASGVASGTTRVLSDLNTALEPSP